MMEPSNNGENNCGLAKMILNGNRTAENELCVKYGQKLLYFIHRKGVPPDQAKDLSQDILIAVIQKARQEEIKNIHAYIMAIYRNKLKKFFEKKNKYRPDEINDDTIIIDDIEPYINQIISREESDNILRVVSNLSDEERTIIELKFKGELNSREIAGRLGLNAGTVRKKLERLLCKLREKLFLTVTLPENK